MCVGTTSASSSSPPAADTEMNQDSHQEFPHRHQRNDKAKGTETTQRASDQERAPAQSPAAAGAGRHDTHPPALTVFLCIYRGLFRKQRLRSCLNSRSFKMTSLLPTLTFHWQLLGQDGWWYREGWRGSSRGALGGGGAPNSAVRLRDGRWGWKHKRELYSQGYRRQGGHILPGIKPWPELGTCWG